MYKSQLHELCPKSDIEKCNVQQNTEKSDLEVNSSLEIIPSKPRSRAKQSLP